MPATILIVDDEKNTREGLGLALEEDFEVYDIRKHLRDFFIDRWEFLLNNIVRDSTGMHTPHEQIVGRVFFTEICKFLLLFAKILEFLLV